MSKTVVSTNKHLIEFLSLIIEKYQFYRPFHTNTDLLQTQTCQKVFITDPLVNPIYTNIYFKQTTNDNNLR